MCVCDFNSFIHSFTHIFIHSFHGFMSLFFLGKAQSLYFERNLHFLSINRWMKTSTNDFTWRWCYIYWWKRRQFGKFLNSLKQLEASYKICCRQQYHSLHFLFTSQRYMFDFPLMKMLYLLVDIFIIYP